MDIRKPRRLYSVKEIDPSSGKVKKIIPPKELRKRKTIIKPARHKNPRGRDFRKKLVANATFAERLFKRFLREAGVNFRFQKLIHVGNRNYRYADFYLPALKWIIEIDGKYHELPNQVVLDKKRTDEILEVKPGFEIVRYTNEQVLNEPELIMDELFSRMRERFAVALNELRK